LAAGENFTFASHVAAGPSEDVQVVEAIAYGPVTVTEEMLAVVAPGLPIVNVRVALLAPTSTVPKSNAGGESVIGAAAAPVPCRPAVTVPVEAGTTREPETSPVAAGTNFTFVAQFEVAARVAPQVVETIANGPVVESVPSDTGDEPGLVIVNEVGVLDEPTTTVPKSRLAGSTVTFGGATDTPLPTRPELTEPLPAVALIVPVDGPTATGP
jgi:hypothetical protein